MLNERRALANAGVIVLSATFDVATDELLAGPEIRSKGLVYVKEYGQILDDAVVEIETEVRKAVKDRRSRQFIEKLMVDTLKKYIYKNINREPVIIPVFMEV